MTLIHGPFLAGAYWTLPIELSFYFLIFLLLWFKEFRHIQLFAIALVLWSAPYLIVLMLNTWGVLQMPSIDFGFGAGNMSLLRHGPFFALGILIWLLKEKRIRRTGILAAVCALMLGTIDIYTKSAELFRDFTSSSLTPQPYWNHLDLAANAAFFIGFLGILLSVKLNYLFPQNVTARRIVRLAGLTTYPFYLLHQRVGGYVSSEMLGQGVGHVTSVVIALLCTGGVSLLVALYGEPALRSFLKKIAPVLRSSSRIDAPVTQEKA
jgi:peptidoglycan/LPS O-acetylase OafA/YrhL